MSSLETFRSMFAEVCQDQKSKFDERDVIRVNNDEIYASSILTWKKGDVEESVKLTMIILEFRKKHRVNDLAISDISAEFYSKKSIFMHGRCADGSIAVYFIGKRFLKESEAEAKKLFIYLLEHIRRLDPKAKVTFFLDASDCGMANVDLGFMRIMVDCFMHYYPGMLCNTYVIDLPIILVAIWNIVKLWFDEQIREKTHNVSRKDISRLEDYENLLVHLGGKDTWEPTTIEEDLKLEFN